MLRGNPHFPAPVCLIHRVLVLLLLVAGVPAVTTAQELPAQGFETWHVAGTGSQGLVLRVTADPEAPVLGVLPEGTSVLVVGGPIAADGEPWYEVRMLGAGSLGGYVSGAYLTPGPASAAPALPVAGARVLVGTVTGYANGSDGGAVGSRTASGTRTRWGTIAADVRRYPMGTRLLIEGFDVVVFVVEDTGSGVRGDIFDVWFPDVPSAAHFGTQRRQVTILPD